MGGLVKATSTLGTRGSSLLHVVRGGGVGHGSHRVCSLALRRHIVRGEAGPRPITTRRGVSSKYTRKGGISLVASGGTVSALVVLVISHVAVSC